MQSSESEVGNKVDKWIPNVDEAQDKPPDQKYDELDSHNNESLDSFIPIPPKLPAISTTESFELTPYTSHNEIEDVIYSDSELGSQNLLDLASIRFIDNDRDQSPTRGRVKRTKGRKSLSTPNTPRQERLSRAEISKTATGSPRELTPRELTPKAKRRIRRKSNKSEASEKSHNYISSGYTSTPGTGKVFRNLLILEESLRQQVFQQKALRRKYLTFMAILCAIITSLTHYLYIADNPQTSLSPIRVILTFILLALLVTLCLYYLSGEYQKTIVLPRKFLSSTNKGLRQLNIRLVKIKTPLVDYLADLIRELVLNTTLLLLNLLHKLDPTSIENKNSKLEVLLVSIQLRCQPRTGIADVKLILNARVFNTDIREGWELYRSEFWTHEGIRRRNNFLTFITGGNEEIAHKERLLKREKRERRDRKKLNPGNPIDKLNNENLQHLNEKLNSI